MTDLTGNIRASINLNFNADAEIGEAIEDVLTGANQFTWTIADGTGLDQADLIFSDQRTLTTGANEELDLAGVLVDRFGSLITFARVKMIYIKAHEDNTTLLTIGGAAANEFLGPFVNAGDQISVDADGLFHVITKSETAWPVVGGVNDKLKIANAAGASATYDILIIGASA